MTDTKYWVKYDAEAKVQFTAATALHSSTEDRSISRIQQCARQWDTFDRATQSLFNIMGRIE